MWDGRRLDGRVVLRVWITPTTPFPPRTPPALPSTYTPPHHHYPPHLIHPTATPPTYLTFLPTPLHPQPPPRTTPPAPHLPTHHLPHYTTALPTTATYPPPPRRAHGDAFERRRTGSARPWPLRQAAARQTNACDAGQAVARRLHRSARQTVIVGRWTRGTRAVNSAAQRRRWT